MTGALSEVQVRWLRGLSFNGDAWTPMSATELGNPEVSELQSLALVKIRHPTFAGKEWRITKAGEEQLAALSDLEPKP